MIVTAALRAGTLTLIAAEIPDAARDARRLMAFALDVAPDRLTLVSGDEISLKQAIRFEESVASRALGRPVSQIIGRRHFYGRDFIVTPDVLDPRPETEILISAALEQPFQRVLDLGTGSGAILVTLLAEQMGANGQGADISDAALNVASRNAVALNVSERADFVKSDWFENVDGDFDLIVSNPPYVTADEYDALDKGVREFEPKLALTLGGDGLMPYRLITERIQSFLRPFGRLLVEIGPTQGAAVKAMFKESGLSEVQVLKDFDARDRVVIGRLVP